MNGKGRREDRYEGGLRGDKDPRPFPKVYILTSHGGSRLVTIGQFLPQDWELVRIVPQWANEEAVCLKFERVT